MRTEYLSERKGRAASFVVTQRNLARVGPIGPIILLCSFPRGFRLVLRSQDLNPETSASHRFQAWSLMDQKGSLCLVPLIVIPLLPVLVHQ